VSARVPSRPRGKTPGMDVPRLLAGGLAVNRVAFGASYLARPRNAGRSWIGRAARKPGAEVMVRSQAARDIALGLGALWALSRRPAAEAQAWMLAHALADGVDTAVTFAARDRLPQRQARLALAVAGGSTAVAALGAVGLRRAARA
jgi:hypothetical protein